MAVNSVTGKGEWNAFCQSCQRKFKASQLRQRPEDNLWVCPDDWEPIHPQKFVRITPDNTKLPFVLNQDNVGIKGDAVGTAGQTDIAGNDINIAPNLTYITRVPLSREVFNNAAENFTVYKAETKGVVTLPDGITMTIVTSGSLLVDVGGTVTEFTAGDYTGASSGW